MLHLKVISVIYEGEIPISENILKSKECSLVGESEKNAVVCVNSGIGAALQRTCVLCKADKLSIFKGLEISKLKLLPAEYF